MVSFRAWGVVDDSLDPNQIIVYPVVAQNDGNGYDRTTGIFTAPVAGLYLFTVQAMVYAGEFYYHAIVKDSNTHLVYSAAYEDSGSPTTSSTTAAYLNIGGKVWVKCLNKGSSKILATSNYNQFLGILIHK